MDIVKTKLMELNRPKAPSLVNIYQMTTVAVTVALAVLLGFIRLYRLPWGGSLSLKLLPLVYLAITLGPRAGLTGGLLAGLLTLILDPVVIHPAQVLLDYLLPYSLIGVIGFFPFWPRLGIIITCFLRLISHTVSGAIYFAAYTPRLLNLQVYQLIRTDTGIDFPLIMQDWAAPWLYSLLYNGTLIIPETIIMVVIAPPLIKRLNLNRT